MSAILDMNQASCVIYLNDQKLVEATRAIRNGENPLGKKIPIIAMSTTAQRLKAMEQK